MYLFIKSKHKNNCNAVFQIYHNYTVFQIADQWNYLQVQILFFMGINDLTEVIKICQGIFFNIFYLGLYHCICSEQNMPSVLLLGLKSYRVQLV